MPALAGETRRFNLEKKLSDSDLEALDQFLDRILSFQDLSEVESWWEGRGKTGNA